MRESAFIELAAAANFLWLASSIKPAWDAPVGELVPAEVEKDCYQFAEELGLEPLVEMESMEAIEEFWQKQLRQPRHKDILQMAFLLTRQNNIMNYLQVWPDIEERAEGCYKLLQIRRVLQRGFEKYGLRESLELMPEIPFPNAPETWKEWSGDAMRACVIRELDALNATAPSDTP